MRTPCDCRKPEPGLLLGLAAKWNIDLSASVMIGDRDSDVAAGQAAGCHAYLFDGTDLSGLARHVIDRHFSGARIDDARIDDAPGSRNQGGVNA